MKSLKKQNFLLVSGCISAYLLSATAAFAQTEQETATPIEKADENSSDGLDIIVVTANKRSENMQDVPIAITAIQGEAADKLGLVDPQSLTEFVPGLQMNRQNNGITPYLRGVGNNQATAGNEPAVAMYVDDVYMVSNSSALTSYNSISRIEVLKGPQGTLFGRNATGGVIQVFTKNPSHDASVDMTLGYANYDTLSGSIYATGGLSDTLSMNFAAYGEQQFDGWGKNLTTGNDAYKSKNYGGRVKLLWEPGAATSVLLNADYDFFSTQQSLINNASLGTLGSAGISTAPPPGRYDTFNNMDPVSDTKQYGASLKISHDFEPVRLVSISSYRRVKSNQDFAQDGNSVATLNMFLEYDVRTYTQEVQLLSPQGAAISWVLGAYYLNDSSATDPQYFYGAQTGGGTNRRHQFAEQKTDSFAVFGQATAEIFQNTNLTLGARYTIDKRSLTGGRFNFVGGVLSPTTFATNSGTSDKWTEPTWRITLDHKFSDDIMAYVSYNRGFKSGGYNTTGAPDFVNKNPAPYLLPDPVKPETIDAIAAGFKTQFFDDRVQLNVEGFYYKYRNLQLTQINQLPSGVSASILTNAAAATIKGVDIDFLTKPFNNFTLRANMQFMDGKFDDYPNGTFQIYGYSSRNGLPAAGGNCGLTPTGVGANCINAGAIPPNYDPVTKTWNLRGNKTPNTPPFSVTVTANYNIPSSIGDFDISANWSHTGNYYAEADNGAGQVFPSSPDNVRQSIYDTINGSISWRSTDEKWDVRIWGKNLTKAEYYTYATAGGTLTKNLPAPPRTYGITLSSHF